MRKRFLTGCFSANYTVFPFFKASTIQLGGGEHSKIDGNK